MDYQTYSPCENLSLFVKCYWTLEESQQENAEKQTIVPDGCMEMIFHYGDLYKQYLGNEISIVQPRCFVIGQLTQPLEVEPTGKTGIFSVRFHPEGFLPLATIPIKEMENKAVSLESLFDHDGLDIEVKILDAKSTQERIEYIEDFLSNHLFSIETIDQVVKSTVEMILTVNGQIPINKLSDQINSNRRQLERKFSSAIGLSPKQLSKTIRLQSALKKLLNEEYKSLTELAHEGEYYDQAHFIKDFKELTGYTPKEFYGTNLKMSALFYGTD